MAVQYNKLWKLLIDKKIKPSALIAPSIMAKLDRDEYVALSVLERICLTLDCDIGDVVEIVKEP